MFVRFVLVVVISLFCVMLGILRGLIHLTVLSRSMTNSSGSTISPESNLTSHMMALGGMSASYLMSVSGSVNRMCPFCPSQGTFVAWNPIRASADRIGHLSPFCRCPTKMSVLSTLMRRFLVFSSILFLSYGHSAIRGIDCFILCIAPNCTRSRRKGHLR